MNNVSIVRKLPVAQPVIQAWSLDFPQAGSAPRVTERGLYLQGWVLSDPAVVRGDLVVRASGTGSGALRKLPFNNDRPDVIQRMLGEEPTAHPRLRCGFIAFLKDAPSRFSLGVMIDGDVCWLCEVELQGEPVVVPKAPETQVIRGEDGWLYLDNDTNRSVDQYTGRLLLDDAALSRWKQYFDDCVAVATTVSARHAILIAASKEQVLPEFYPHAKGEVTLQGQVRSLRRNEHRVFDTAELLAARADKTACFIKTDTHWTDRGAMAAVLGLLETLSLDADAAKVHFSSDVYYTMSFAGDLGIKLSPAMSAPTEFLQAPPAANGAVFDNDLPNIGRVLVFDDARTLWPHNLLIFGASSSYPMLKYLKRLFRRIVFVHSAGNVDVRIVAHEQPDFLVMQTTARFMSTPPDIGFALQSAVAEKLRSADNQVRARAKASALKAAQEAKNLPYSTMLETDES